MSTAQKISEKFENDKVALSGILEKAVLEIFEVMFSKKAKLLPVKELNLDDKFLDISAVVKISEKNYRGWLVASFSEASILRLLSSLHRVELTEFNEEVLDGVSEITNIIYGNLKNRANNFGYSFPMVLPKIQYKSELNNITEINSGRSIELQFTLENGERFNLTFKMAVPQ